MKSNTLFAIYIVNSYYFNIGYSNKFSSNEIDKKIKNLFKQMLVVYSVGKLVIIFNEEMNSQSIYKNHEVILNT